MPGLQTSGPWAASCTIQSLFASNPRCWCDYLQRERVVFHKQKVRALLFAGAVRCRRFTGLGAQDHKRTDTHIAVTVNIFFELDSFLFEKCVAMVFCLKLQPEIFIGYSESGAGDSRSGLQSKAERRHNPRETHPAGQGTIL